MFRRLRFRLTLLYLLAALTLIVLLGFGTYGLVDSYFQNVTSLGLEHKMAHEFRQRKEDEGRDPLRQPDRASVARRKHESVEEALLAFGDERPRETEERCEHERNPQHDRAGVHQIPGSAAAGRA